MSNNDDPELRYSCSNESMQVLHNNPHSLTLTVTMVTRGRKVHTVLLV